MGSEIFINCGSVVFADWDHSFCINITCRGYERKARLTGHPDRRYPAESDSPEFEVYSISTSESRMRQIDVDKLDANVYCRIRDFVYNGIKKGDL